MGTNESVILTRSYMFVIALAELGKPTDAIRPYRGQNGFGT